MGSAADPARALAGERRLIAVAQIQFSLRLERSIGMDEFTTLDIGNRPICLL